MKFSIILLVTFYTTIKPSEPSVCARLQDLRDSNGKYLKQVCQGHGAKSYYDAEGYCQENGMRLFTIDSEATAKALDLWGVHNIASAAVWGVNHGTWVNGRRRGHKWYTSDNGELNMTAVEFKDGVMHGGSCLSLKRKNKKYLVSGDTCTKGYWYLCENNVPTTTEISTTEASCPSCPLCISCPAFLSCEDCQPTKVEILELKNEIYQLKTEILNEKFTTGKAIDNFETLSKTMEAKDRIILEKVQELAEKDLKYDNLKADYEKVLTKFNDFYEVRQ